MEPKPKEINNYCRNRCYAQLKHAAFGIMVFGVSLIIFSGIVFFGFDFGGDVATWVAIIVSPIAALVGLWFAALGFRDAFFPEKSDLAKSIRSQLDNPDDDTPIEELFDMVDMDIAYNGKWFDKLAICSEWVFGDEVMKIERVRGVFNETTSSVNGKGRTRYTYTLTLVDNRNQQQKTIFTNKNAMMSAYDTLRVLVPEAFCGGEKELDRFVNLSERERVDFETDFRQKRVIRENIENDRKRFPQDIVLYSGDGNATSRVNTDTLKQAQSVLRVGEYLRLICTHALTDKHGSFSFLDCVKAESAYYLVCSYENDNKPLSFRAFMSEHEALSVLSRFVTDKSIPDVSRWEQLTTRHMTTSKTGEKPVCELIITEHNGGSRTFTSFTREDIELALEDVFSAKTQAVRIACEWLYFIISAKASGDSSLEADASIPVDDMLRHFNTTCDRIQAKRWLLAFYDRIDSILNSAPTQIMALLHGFYPNEALPDITDWKDITKQVQKNSMK